MALLIGPGRAEAGLSSRRRQPGRSPAFQSSAGMRQAFRRSPTFRFSLTLQSSPAMRQVFAPSPAFGSSPAMRQAFANTRRIPGATRGRPAKFRL